MYPVLTYIAGILTVLGVFGVIRFAQSKGVNLTRYFWIGAAVWYVWTFMGFSFVIINAVGGHSKAATVGSVFFFVISIAGAVLLARSLQIIKTSKPPKMQTAESKIN